MKNIFTIAIILAFTITSVNAQNISYKCYRGYVDAGYTFGSGNYDFGRFEVNTSYGYQINPYFFIGVGGGFHFMSSYKTPGMDIPYDTRDSKVDIPLFANARCNILKGKISPFIDLKGGTYVNNNGGLYVNLSVGCRISTKAKRAVNFSVGCTSEKLEFQTFSHFTSNYNLNYIRKPVMYHTEGITLKMGYEF